MMDKLPACTGQGTMKRILSTCLTLLVFTGGFALAQTEPAEKPAPQTPAPVAEPPEPPRQLQAPPANDAAVTPASTSRQYTVVRSDRTCREAGAANACPCR